MAHFCAQREPTKGKGQQAVRERQDRTGQDIPRPKPMLAAVHRPPFGNQDQLSLLLIDNRFLNRSSPPGHVSPCGLVEVAFKERNVREKGLE